MCYALALSITRAVAGSGGTGVQTPLASNRTTHEIWANPSFLDGWRRGSKG